MIIRHTSYNINEIYLKSCRADPSKVTKIAKITKFTIIRHTTYKINEIYSKGCREGRSKVTKIMKFTIIRHTTHKINGIYSKGCREGPLKVTVIAKITKFTKTAKFAEIIDKINEIQGNCDIYENLLAHQRNRRKLFKGSDDSP